MKVMVIDTVGGERFSNRYRAMLPGITLIGHEMEDYGPCQEHGYQCGYYAGVLLTAIPGAHELHFVRCFDDDGRHIPYSESYMLHVIEDVRPDIITRSWGQHDGDIDWANTAARNAWAGWSAKYRELQRRLGFIDFGASGNDDGESSHSAADNGDLDNDIAYPQRLMPGVSNVIGSMRRDGVPSRFSGDGIGVQCVMWGENVALLNHDGQWARGSGTSFACPKAAGLCAALRAENPAFDHAAWCGYVLKHATQPENWTGWIPHPKWGYGSLEYRYQERLARVLPEIQPPSTRATAPAGTRFYYDFEEAQ